MSGWTVQVRDESGVWVREGWNAHYADAMAMATQLREDSWGDLTPDDVRVIEGDVR